MLEHKRICPTKKYLSPPVSEEIAIEQIFVRQMLKKQVNEVKDLHLDTA